MKFIEAVQIERANSSDIGSNQQDMPPCLVHMMNIIASQTIHIAHFMAECFKPSLQQVKQRQPAIRAQPHTTFVVHKHTSNIVTLQPLLGARLMRVLPDLVCAEVIDEQPFHTQPYIEVSLSVIGHRPHAIAYPWQSRAGHPPRLPCQRVQVMHLSPIVCQPQSPVRRCADRNDVGRYFSIKQWT